MFCRTFQASISARSGLRGLRLSARFGPERPSLSACQLFLIRLGPAAHDEPPPAAVGFYALGEAKNDSAEVLRSRLQGGVLTSDTRRLERAEVLTPRRLSTETS